MSWQVAAFAILGLALALGFAWYERTRPDARIVALVGTLAALAALGRIAFAAVPNVKPTSDVVLIAGYALGGGPGFAVGAIAGLTSNFFFGQGPWTPWQMAAWGVTGVVGAALATAYRARRPGVDRARAPGRWPLALVCCVCGFAFTAVQDAGDWVTYSDHSLPSLGAYVGSGLGFDGIYAASCLVFALAFGPALLRSIQRVTRRLEITWLKPGSSVMPAVVAVVAAGALVAAGVTATPAARAATASGLRPSVAYLLRSENHDGGFGAAPGQSSSPDFSAWAALGLRSAGVPLTDAGVLAYLERRAGASDPASLERDLLVAGAAGISGSDFGGHDLLAALRARFRANGSISGQVNLTTFAMLALRAVGAPVPARTTHWLESQQDRDGGYGFAGRGGSSDVDDTGSVLEALGGVAGARARSVRRRSVSYLRRQQDRDGGFPSQPGAGSNTQSTAWAVQGLIAAGVDPSTVHRSGGRSPLSYLRALIGSDGAIAYARGQRQTPVWVTGEALMALAGKPLPLAPPAAHGPIGSSRHARAGAGHRSRGGARAAGGGSGSRGGGRAAGAGSGMRGGGRGARGGGSGSDRRGRRAAGRSAGAVATGTTAGTSPEAAQMAAVAAAGAAQVRGTIAALGHLM